MQMFCFFVGFATAAGRLPTGIVGDQAPPSYPIIDVHVPEPSLGLAHAKQLLDDSVDQQIQLDDVKNRILSEHALTVDALSAVTTKIKEIANMVQHVITGEENSVIGH